MSFDVSGGVVVWWCGGVVWLLLYMSLLLHILYMWFDVLGMACWVPRVA
jgi:hypothetical protein